MKTLNNKINCIWFIYVATRIHFAMENATKHLLLQLPTVFKNLCTFTLEFIPHLAACFFLQLVSRQPLRCGLEHHLQRITWLPDQLIADMATLTSPAESRQLTSTGTLPFYYVFAPTPLSPPTCLILMEFV